MSDDEQISLLERYVLAEDKETFFASLVQNSDTYVKMRLLDSVNRHGLDVPADVAPELAAFLGHRDNRHSVVAFKSRLLQLEKGAAHADLAQLGKLLDEFNDDYLQCRFHQYGRPANVQKSGGAAADDASADARSTRLDLDKWDLDARIKAFGTASVSWSDVQKFTRRALPHLDLGAMMDKNDRALKHVLDTLESYAHVQPPALAKVLARYHKAHTEGGKAFSFPDDWLRKMTVQQLEAVKDAVPAVLKDTSFVAEWFRKTFHKDLPGIARAVDYATPQEHREVLMKMHAWAKKLPATPANEVLAVQMLREVLQLDLKTNSIREDAFIEYMKHPISGTESWVYAEAVKPIRLLSDWDRVHNLQRGQWDAESDFLFKYLCRLLKGASSTAAYEAYFSQAYLGRAYCHVKLLSGQSVPRVADVLSERELTELKEEKRLRFAPWCKRQFHTGESVDVTLEVKNVECVTVNTYVIDTDGYYRRNQSPIAERIDLTGMLPSSSTEHTFSEAPVVEHELVLKNLIEPKRGVYVVEFVGGGLCSRAVIRVGALTVVSRPLSKGILFTVVDETRAVCHGDTTSITLDGREMKPEEKLGFGVLVPYTSSGVSGMAVVRHEGYAELQHIRVPAEHVAFAFALMLNEESMVSGGTVQLLLMPTLTVCGQPVSLITLKEVTAEVVAVDNKGVSSSQRFEDLQIRTGKGLALNYMMAPKTVYLTVRLTAQLYSAAQADNIDLAAAQTVGINRFEGQPVLSDLFVGRDGEAYTAQLLGKNGEAYGGQKLAVRVSPRYYGSDEEVELHTDKDGVAHLGAIAKCATAVTLRTVDVPGGERPEPQGYTLFQDNAADTVPASVDAVEGEDIVLPAAPSAVSGANRPQYVLVELCKSVLSTVVTSHAAKLQVAGGVLVIKGLTKGVYRLTYLDHCRSVQIRVLEGKRWASSPSEYVEQRQTIEKLGNQAQSLACSPLDIRGGGAVEFTVSSPNLAAVEVHAFAYCFAPRTVPTMLNALASLRHDVTPCSHAITTGKCTYLSERRLADEVLYVMNRKRRRDGVLGNTLEKPPGLLKRQFVRDTTQDDEKLHQGNDFNAEMCDERCAEIGMGDCKQMCPKEATLGGALWSAARGGMYGAAAPVRQGDYNISALGSFLATKGWTQFCIAPDATTGKVAFTVPANQGFSTLVVVVRDMNSNTLMCAPLPQSTRQLQPRTLVASRQANKVYAHARVAHKLLAGATCEITDGASYYLLDDVAAAVKVLKLIRDDPAWSEWDFLARWASLTPVERLKKYDELMCHEFNLFAYFKDKEFFDVVVKPHIQSKSRKQLIDHLLLGHTAEARKQCTLDELSKLSVIEKTVLVYFLRSSEPELCAAIVRDMQAHDGAARDDQSEFERRFDSVLAGQEIAPQNQPPPPPMAPMAAMNMLNARATGMMMDAGGPMAMRSRAMRAAPAMTSAMNMAAKDMAMEEVLMKPAVEVERYRELDSTNEYSERQFHGSATAPRAEYYKFWADAAAHFVSGDAGAPLLTEKVIYAATSVCEAVLAVSLLGIPVKAAEHESKTVNGTLRLTAGSTCMVFTKVIEEKGDAKMDIDVLVSQRFFDPDDRYTVAADGTRSLKAAKEFLTGKLYMSRVAVTNSTESQHEVSVVTEVPQGSVPVLALDFTTTNVMELEPLTTEVMEFYFYFPRDGDFTYFPATVSKAGCLVATASGTGTVSAVRQRTIVEMNTLADVLSQGNCDDILAFMAKVNLHKAEVFQFSSIYWLLRDATFYKGVLELLRKSAMFEPIVWSFAIMHRDYGTFVEYLRWRTTQLVPSLDNVLYVATKDLEVSRFEYKEYSPLVLARTHDVGAYKHNIRNKEFRTTYRQFLTFLAQKHPRLDSRDYLLLATYLFLQERVDDVARIYPLIKPAEIDGEMKIQYDYLTAYLDIYQGYPTFAKAREVSMQYVTYPVFSWRNRFIDVLNLLAEFDGDAAVQQKAQESDADKNARLAKSEPYLSCEMQSKEVCVTVRNIGAVTVNFHAIDMELLFSTNPFMDADNVDCSYVVPTAATVRAVGEEAADNVLTTVRVAVPDALAQTNLVVHVVAGTLMESVTYLPASMSVQVNRNFGLVKVLAEGTHKPLPKLYVKAFARFHDGDVKFFKDGYTDLRGSFEYAAVNSNAGLDKIAEFSLLVCGGEHGAVICRTPPPSKVATVNVTARTLVSSQMQVAQSSMAQAAQNQYYF